MWCSVVVVVVVVVVAVVVVVVVCQSDLEHADFTEDGWPASRWLVWPLGIRFLLRETELACVAFSGDEIKLNEVEKLVIGDPQVVCQQDGPISQGVRTLACDCTGSREV